MSTTYICLCCGRNLPGYQFGAGSNVCTLCEQMSVRDAVIMTRATADRILAVSLHTRAGRKEARMAAKLAKYAVTGKRCTSCHEHKAPDQYNRCAPQPDGLQPICRSCNKLRVTILESGAGLGQWHIVRDALRQASATKLAKSSAPADLT